MKRFSVPVSLQTRWQNIAALILVITALFASATSHAAIKAAGVEPRVPVVILSLDGFRNDYINRGYSPNLAQLQLVARQLVARKSVARCTHPGTTSRSG